MVQNPTDAKAEAHLRNMNTSMFGEKAVAMENMESRCEKSMIVNLRPNLSDMTPLETAPEKQKKNNHHIQNRILHLWNINVLYVHTDENAKHVHWGCEGDFPIIIAHQIELKWENAKYLRIYIYMYVRI